MHLCDRFWSCELTEIEKELLFRRENTGYVRWVDRKHKIAHLYPSPFLKAKEDEFYVFLTEEIPEERELIEVKIGNIEKIPLTRSKNGYYYSIKKEVIGWKRLSPFKLMKRVTLEDLGINVSNLNKENIEKLKRTEYWEGRICSLVDVDMARDLVLYPFQDVDEIVADTILIYLLSSPPDSYKGGINAAALIRRKNVWKILKRIFGVIPPDFRKIHSPYFYKYSESPGNLVLDQIKADEICLEFVNPESIHIHVPQPLLDAKVKDGAYSRIKEDFNLLRAFMLQGLLLTPRIKEGAEKAIREGAYKVHEAIYSRAKLPFMLDMNFVRRVPLSMGRLLMKEEVDKRSIKSIINNWLDAYNEALKIETKPISPKYYFEMTKHERVIYNIIVEHEGLEKPVSVREILDELSKKAYRVNFDDYLFEQTLYSLRMKGFIYEVKTGMYLAIEMKK